MKLFYLPPKKFAEAVIIAVILSFAISMAFAPHQTDTPTVVITPVPAPAPVYIQSTPTPEPTTDVDLTTAFEEIMTVMGSTFPIVYAVFVLTPLLVFGGVSRGFGLVVSFSILGFTLLCGVVYPWFVLTLVLAALTLFTINTLLHERVWYE